MTEKQQQIIDMLSAEISLTLVSCEHYRNESGNIDKIESYIESYVKQITKLRSIRESLENEFTVLHYDPR